MALTFTQVPADLQDALQKNAGVLLTEFDPKATISESFKQTMRSNILLATDGGVNFTDSISYKDSAEGIDNLTTGTMETLEVENREVKITGTGKSVSSEAMLRLMALATKSNAEAGLEKYTPTDVIDSTHFKDLWYVCDYGTKGGFIAIRMMNTLNRDGFSLQSANKDKGSFAFGFQAHYSIEDTDKVPYEIYVRHEAKATA